MLSHCAAGLFVRRASRVFVRRAVAGVFVRRAAVECSFVELKGCTFAELLECSSMSVLASSSYRRSRSA